MAERTDGRTIGHGSAITQAGFTMIPNAVMLRHDLSPTAKLLYGYMKHLAWRDGSYDTQPPREQIADDLTLSLTTVTKAIKELSEAPIVYGDDDAAMPTLIVVRRRGQGHTNIYVINDPAEWAPEYVEQPPEDPERRKDWARRRVSLAMAKGDIAREPCVVCGNPTSQGHHEDYTKPLDVVWLCQLHHRRLHSSRKPLSVFLEEHDVDFLARARSLPEHKKRLDVSNDTSEREQREPPKIVHVNGRNVALDALLAGTGVDPKSPRVAAAAVALNGLTKAGVLKTPGIRHLHWIEAVRWAETHDGIDRLDLAYEDLEGWATGLARRIGQKAERYRTVYSGAAISPQALRNHWLDLELAPTAGGGLSADDIERFTDE